jgi:hypothetical protein
MAENDRTQEQTTAVVSISKLMDLFRDSLMSLVPELEKAQVTWDSFDEIEEIDTICESLFNLIIFNKLDVYVSGKFEKSPKIPKYGFFIKDYADYDTIEVTLEDSDSRFIFVMLASREEAFDTVLCNQIDDKGHIVQRDIEFKIENVEFTFHFKKA